jgi:hypothetical protein
VATVHTATAEQVDRLFKHLEITQPVQIGSISPYGYFLQGARPSPSARLAWIIARTFNATHLEDHRMFIWHLSGAALTIWLTRNWTPTELIAKAVELEMPIATSPSP